MDPFGRRRSVGGRLVPRVEALPQAVAERAVELAVSALDLNALLDRIDLNGHSRLRSGGSLFAYSWAASGRTAGMALFGVRVVRDDGTDASGRRAVVRTLAFPLSFLFLGLGFAGILVGGRRRALHDVIAGTAVIYSWDAKAARLRFLVPRVDPAASRRSR